MGPEAAPLRIAAGSAPSPSASELDPQPFAIIKIMTLLQTSLQLSGFGIY